MCITIYNSESWTEETIQTVMSSSKQRFLQACICISLLLAHEL